MNDFIQAFKEEMARFKLQAPPDFSADGEFHRFVNEGDKHPNSWYVLYADEPQSGAFGCWKKNISENWCFQNGHTWTSQELAEAKKKWAIAAQKKTQEQEKAQAEASVRAQELWNRFEKCESNHGYLLKKNVPSFGLRISDMESYAGWAVLDLRDASGKIMSLQFISEGGDKRFLWGGRKHSCFFTIDGREDCPLLICEGYATGATLYQATGFTVVCAMDCGNIPNVARAMREKYRDRKIVICADNDHKTEGNPGVTKANLAAEKTGALVSIPEFPDAYEGDGTDFNDLEFVMGMPAVKNSVLKALSFPIAIPIGDLKIPPQEDANELIKHRYLCRGGGVLVVGPTGIGKSSFILQALALFANGLPCFGLEPTRPLSSIYIQAENDDGDIAEIRDGIAKGLGFNETQRRNFFSRVLVLSENQKVSASFFNGSVIPILETNPGRDLLAIDPALSYVGGEVKDQKVVGEFLRIHLSPILTRFAIGCFVVHHTNKPSGNIKPDWSTTDMAYLGSGSSEWANWSRAVLALQSTGKNGIFKLHAAKRGTRLSWKNEVGERVFNQVIKHHKEPGVICWLPATEDDIEPAVGGRPQAAEMDDFMDLLGDSGLTSGEWFKSSNSNLGISRPTFYRLKTKAEEMGITMKSKINSRWVRVNPKANND